MLLFLVSLIFSVFSIFYKKSKILLVLVFIFMWILFGFNYSNADYSMYEYLYNEPKNQFVFFKLEGGYSLLMYFFKVLGLNFQQYLILISGIILLLLFRFINAFAKFPALCAIIIFWIFFPLQYVILRNFLAFVIVLQGFYCILNKEEYSKPKFVFFVFLASTIHISSLFYFIFLLALKEKQLKIKTISIISICLLGLVSISHHFIFNILSLYSRGKAIFYSTDTKLFFLYSLLQIINLIIVYNFLKPEVNSSNIDNRRIKNIILNSNIIMLFIIPIYFELAVFVRMLLNMSIVNTVFITNRLFDEKPKMIFKFFYFSYLLLLFAIFIYRVKDTTIFSLFYKNLLTR